MKSILLSFGYEWYESLKDGRKIYEHRKRFCNEAVKAYVYIGKPIYRVVAIVTLDKRIDLEKWLVEYGDDLEVRNRIKDFMSRNKYAMPVLDFQEICPIDLSEFKLLVPNFIVPRSYYILENNVDLFSFLKERTEFIGAKRINEFNVEPRNVICTY